MFGISCLYAKPPANHQEPFAPRLRQVSLRHIVQSSSVCRYLSALPSPNKVSAVDGRSY